MKARVVAAYIFTICLGGCEQLDASYATYQLMVNSKAIESGWVPQWIPASSYEIEEAHDIDTNQSMLAFKHRESQWQPPNPCLPFQSREIPPAPFSKSWWPKFEQQQFVFYSCPSNEYIAVNAAARTVFHWRPRGR